jgi:16S rRNA (guanine527-N7)-methyltransferase
LQVSPGWEQGNRFGPHLATDPAVFFYLRELQKWNRSINLTGCDDDLSVIRNHFVDSLSCTLSSAVAPRSRLLDIGAGAGFPAIPLKIYHPEMPVVAVDAVAKKIMFLRQLCRVLALQHVECVAVRLAPSSLRPPQDDISSRFDPLLQRRYFDLIVARAVGSIPLLIALAAPFLAPNGHIILQRGRDGRHELHEHQAFLRDSGFHLVEMIEVRFSFFTYPRYLMVLRCHGSGKISSNFSEVIEK